MARAIHLPLIATTRDVGCWPIPDYFAAGGCSWNWIETPPDQVQGRAFPDHALGARRQDQRDNNQRHQSEQEAEHQHAERAPAPAAIFARSRLRRDTLDEV